MNRQLVDQKILEACKQLDERAARWQHRLRQLALPLALAVPLGTTACVQAETDAGALACEDGIDNDGDGEVDCADDDCDGEPPCSVDLYGAPF